MRAQRSRRGVAAVVGTMIFVFVLLAAMAAQLYTASMEAQSEAAARQAVDVAALKGSEQLVFATSSGAVSVVSAGPTSSLEDLLLRFANGTVFALAVSASVPAGSSVSLPQLVPSSGCGATPCTARYASIASGTSAGGVGIVTALGNTFWYVPAAQPSSQGPGHSWTTSAQSTISTSFVPVAGLSFTGAAGGRYVVTLIIGYYQSSQSSPGLSFGLSAPAGASLLACGGLSHPASVPTCTAAPNAAFGSTVFTGNSVYQAQYCNGASDVCEFEATVAVTLGSASGAVQVEYEVSGGTGTVVADSTLTVVPG